jgi:hypothetical protein
MSALWVDQDKVRTSLASFFRAERQRVIAFGQTVNQTFEAFVFASVVNWYKEHGWQVELIHPTGENSVKLKFNTRGRPSGYTFARCRKHGIELHIRHNLRVATRHHAADTFPAANICLDVAVVAAHDVSNLSTNDHVDNSRLVTFAEAKHMSAFAELIANFVGLAHEMTPDRLREARPYVGPLPDPEHLAPFLYVSGYLYPTARGLCDTIRRRGLDLDIYDHEGGSVFGFSLHTIVAPKRNRKRRAKVLPSTLRMPP